MIEFCKRTAGSTLFHDLIVVVIILNAVILGIETSQHIMQSVGGGIYTINWVVQAIFVFEIAVRILAHWPIPLMFFRGGWNLFDFIVVVAAFLPVNGSFATIGRLLRLLRVSGEQDLEAAIAQKTLDAVGLDPAPQAILGLQQLEWQARAIQFNRTTEPRHPATHDNHVMHRTPRMSRNHKGSSAVQVSLGSGGRLLLAYSQLDLPG